MRQLALAALAIAACHKDASRAAPGDAAPHPPRDARIAPVALPPNTYGDLASALAAIIPDDARVIGFGELHARTDRPHVTSALARFTRDALPALAPKLSDLVIETWLLDTHCGKTAAQTSARVQTTMKRPAETTNEIGALADAARKEQIQPRAMQVSCDDYARIAPAGKDIQADVLLTLTTNELGRVATEALTARDADPKHRPWIALYGGALHNDRFPDDSVAEWSYAAKVDAATHGHFVEIDLIVPELADGDPMSQKEPWYGLASHADDVFHVWKRGDRSFVIVMPRSAPTAPEPK